MREFRFGFTGTQRGMTDEQRETLRGLLRDWTGEFHHGDCIGADAEAHDIADMYGYGIIIHPPTNYSKRAWREVPRHMMRPEKSYLVRNRAIVDDTMALLAAPGEYDEQLRSGTWSTIRYANRQGKRAAVIYPNGVMQIYSASIHKPTLENA